MSFRDRESLIAFFDAVFKAMGFDFDLQSKDKDLRNIPGLYQTGNGQFFLAKQAGQVIGTIALRQLAEDRLELKRFYVRSDYQDQGIGTKLLLRA